MGLPLRALRSFVVLSCCASVWFGEGGDVACEFLLGPEHCVICDWKYSGFLGYFTLEAAITLTPHYKLTFWKSSAAVE